MPLGGSGDGQVADTPGTVRRPCSSTLVKIMSGTIFIEVDPNVTVYPYFFNL